MTTEVVILIAVIAVLFGWIFHLHTKYNALEYRVLLLTEAFAESQGKEGEGLAKQIRSEIKKNHWMLDALVQAETE
jgi:hypothetical protein